VIYEYIMEGESETEKRIREYWASAYKNKNKNSKSSIYSIGSLDIAKNDNDNELPFEPTAVLTSNPNPKERKFRLRDLINLDLSRLIMPII
jgi:hypothetical protein